MKILILFSIFFSLFFTNVNCSKKEIEKIESDKESGSTVALRKFERVYYDDNGVKEWRLIAKESYIFSEEDRTVFYDMQFFQFEEGKITSELESDWGEVNHTTKKLVLKGNIFLITPDKKSLKTEFLNYDLETQELTTDEEVQIYSSGTSIRGMGLRAKKDLNQFTIIRPTAVTRGGENPFKKDSTE
ncbi:LPS export ABC transporter periplasmic protein LptC [Leptospira sp. GIMC2001]|uniref:LPS export ABC transporter periplasmic protein LptC n=1 Tax=Leptospira sp. GIMC2001 TaxID=1513297 RepID=UPI00234B1EEA|nr:LPS export ABC transporter periplasmic protein LptC [Leptospira sp. GIMC2001]WCL47908.1 LPS export ABC transporter periplasmic protein LptC [Leptospira sp. GIMC2001]